MRGIFSRKFKRRTEEGSIFKKALLRISTLTTCVSLFFYISFNFISSSSPETFTLKRFLYEALVPAFIGAFCTLGIFFHIIYHIKKIIEKLLKDKPDWHQLENEYMESDIRGLYLSIKKLHDQLSAQAIKLEETDNETSFVLAKLNARIDEERRLLARQLHDDVNPKLILCKLELERLLPTINKNIVNTSEKNIALSSLTTIAQLLDDIYCNSREIISNTRIEIIDSIGLSAALESLIHHYQRILDKPIFSIKNNLPEHLKIPNDAAVNIYRIIQEALLNIIKHAQAHHANLFINFDDQSINILISDDGIGIDTKNSPGIGLIDMRERAKTLGGNLHITHTYPGTTISFTYHINKFFA